MASEREIWIPNPGPQTLFLATTAREVLYGGAVGGGKTEAILVGPLRHAAHPKHRAIILRRTEDRLREIIDRSRELYDRVIPGATWNETRKRWEFPSGAKIWMGHAEREPDIEKYKTFEFNEVYFDELTEFTEDQYLFMFSRNRSKSADLPLMIRAGTNPGGEGMAWVDQRFIQFKSDGTTGYEPNRIYPHTVTIRGKRYTITRQFIPSSIYDNPKLPDRDAYIAGLGQLSPEEQDAYIHGKWGRFKGQFFPKLPKEVAPFIKTDLGPYFFMRGMDYGWTDPTAFLWAVIYPEVPRIEIAAEIYQDHLATESLAALAAEIEAELHVTPNKLLASVLSPDAIHRKGQEGTPSIGDKLSAHGLWFAPANNHRINGWAQLLDLIQRDELVVWEGRAPNLLRTLGKLPREPSDGRDVKKKGVEDHAPEALRYIGMAYQQLGGDWQRLARTSTGSHDPEADRMHAATNPNRDPHWDRLQSEIAQAQEYGEQWVDPYLGAGW